MALAQPSVLPPFPPLATPGLCAACGLAPPFSTQAPAWPTALLYFFLNAMPVCIFQYVFGSHG